MVGQTVGLTVEWLVEQLVVSTVSSMVVKLAGMWVVLMELNSAASKGKQMVVLWVVWWVDVSAVTWVDVMVEHRVDEMVVRKAVVKAAQKENVMEKRLVAKLAA